MAGIALLAVLLDPLLDHAAGVARGSARQEGARGEAAATAWRAVDRRGKRGADGTGKEGERGENRRASMRPRRLGTECGTGDEANERREARGRLVWRVGGREAATSGRQSAAGFLKWFFSSFSRVCWGRREREREREGERKERERERETDAEGRA